MRHTAPEHRKAPLRRGRLSKPAPSLQLSCPSHLLGRLPPRSLPTLMKKVLPSQLHLEKTASMGDGMPQPSLIRRGLVVGRLLPFSSQ